jgi:RimJ/RimL family protein N-acetyltransferase
MNFRALKKENMRQVLEWRSKCPEALRTPFQLTEEQQLSFYDNVICNRNADAKFWAIEVEIKPESYGETTCSPFNKFIGMIGLENIQWTNRLAEISIILDPECQGKGYGKEAIGILLDKGFNQMNLDNIYGETYVCNPAYEFWGKMCKLYNAQMRLLPYRKYYNGVYYDSLYFNFNKGDYIKCRK